MVVGSLAGLLRDFELELHETDARAIEPWDHTVSWRQQPVQVRVTGLRR